VCVVGCRLVPMKIITYNVRGLDGFEKRSEFRRLIVEKKPFVLCLQESKLSTVDDLLMRSLWGSSAKVFSLQPSLGASGGLITVWYSNCVEVWSTSTFAHVLVIRGRVLQTGQEFVIANVYAPCDMLGKQMLWDQLLHLVQTNCNANLCLCGDFNSVRSIEERRGRGSTLRQHDMVIFYKFIDDGLLVDLPICGRLFTWYRVDGHSMSRLDRYLLSVNWCSTWPNFFQVANQRGLSDHVPLVLSVDVDNWGLRPLRMFKCWVDFPGYAQFVREKWGSFNIEGWGGFVLKQKLKLIKRHLKDWHKQHTQNMEGKCNTVKERMSFLDIKGETSALLEEEVVELHDLFESLRSMSCIQTSMYWQEMRLKWLQEGDANTKFCIGIMSSWKRHNAIQMLHVNGVQIEGVQNVHEAVFQHFSSHYKVTDSDRPEVEELRFPQLSMVESVSLTRPFTLEEVKRLVWDFDSFKSPGPDGISFGFLKQFWPELKEDFMHFVSEFHRNGRLNTKWEKIMPYWYLF
jgi:exonuclease III